MVLIAILPPKYLADFDRRYLARYEKVVKLKALQSSTLSFFNFRGQFLISLVSPVNKGEPRGRFSKRRRMKLHQQRHK